MMQQPYEEDDGPGWGAAAATLAGLGLATPMGRPFRQKAMNAYEHFGSPFAGQFRTVGNELGKVGSTLRNDISSRFSSPELDELGRITYAAGPAYRAEQKVPYANTGEFSKEATAQNWRDTVGGVKDIARAIAAMSAARPEAIKALKGLTEKGESMRIAPEDWKKFLNHRASRGFSDEALNEMSRYAVTDPFAAALMYIKKYNA